MKHNSPVLSAAAVFGLGIGLCAAPASAQTRTSISSLYYTGVTNAGTSAAANSADAHYFLVGNPAGSASAANPAALFVTQADGFPIGPWLNYDAANGVSRWIEPISGSTDDHAAGTYIFRTTFNLTGFVANSAQLSLRVAVDNDLTEVRVNGASVAGTAVSGFSNFSSAISLTSANTTFANGINTLDFVVVNQPGGTTNPTGLRVEATGTAITAAAAPEPGTLALLLTMTGPMGGAFLARHRRRKSARQ